MYRSIITFILFISVLSSCKLFNKSKIEYTEAAPAVDSAAAGYGYDWSDYNGNPTWTGKNEILYSNYKGSVTKVWDLQHTELSLQFDFENRSAWGSAVLALSPHLSEQNQLILDAKGMKIKQVLELDSSNPGKHTDLYFQYTDTQHLNIKLSRKYKKHETLRLEIIYSAYPYENESKGGTAITGDRGLYFINHDLKNPFKPRQIWTQGETESSSRWFPTLDAPNQKTTLKISLFVPDTMITLSNGTLTKSMPSTTAGIRMDVWEQKLPHAPYLTMIAVGNWAVVKDTWRNKQVQYLVEKSYEPYAPLIFGNTPKMMEFFSQYLGVDYPWDKYNQVVVRDFVSGAMENTTATVHMEQLQHTAIEHRDETYEDYISHELFHQWFGDLVTTESWSNITLNESFATYGEYLWREHFYGKNNAEGLLNDLREQYKYGYAEDKHLVRYQYEGTDELFDNVSYQKGATILHMLRYTIGEDAFRQGLKLYLTQYRFKSAEVAGLRMAFEEVSGQDLQWFFNQWYFDANHPEILLALEEQDNGHWALRIEQTQYHRNTYAFPVKIQYMADGEIRDTSVFVDHRIYIVDLATHEKPEWYIFDSDNILLCDEILQNGNYEETLENLNRLRLTWEHASEGNKLRIVDMMVKMLEFYDEETITTELQNEVGALYTSSMNSQNDHIIRRAMEFAGGNNSFDLITPSADGESVDSKLYEIAENAKLNIETRKTAIVNLYYSGMKDKALLRFTKDSSLAISTFAIAYLSDPEIWESHALNTGIQSKQGTIAAAWARKLIVNERGNATNVLLDLATNDQVNPEQYYKALKAVFYYTPLESQIATSNDLAAGLKEREKQNLLRTLLFCLSEEIQDINAELNEMDDYDPQLVKDLSAKKKSFEELISKFG